MHIQRQTPMELILQDGSRWMAFVFVPAAICIAVPSLEKHKPLGLLVAAFFLFFSAVFMRHTTFTLDKMQRAARWRRRTVLKDENGSIPFDIIRDVVIDTQSGDRGTMSYRLSIVTADGPTPMANVFSGGRIEHYQQLRRQILDFIGLGTAVPAPQSAILTNGSPNDGSASSGCSGIPADLEPSLRALLAQGRKLDAIKLLHSRENFGLADAVSRLNALDQRMQAGK